MDDFPIVIKMKTKLLFPLVVLALLTIVPFGTVQTATIQLNQTVTDIKLGGLFPLTGSLSAGGVEREAATRMAIKQINADNTAFPNINLELIIRDTKTDATTGATVAQQVRDLGVVGVIGAASSGVSAAVQGVLKQSKIPQISYSSTAPGLSDKTEHPYFLRVVSPDNLQGRALSDILKLYGFDNVATLATSDDFGLGAIEVFETEAAADGITVSTSQRFSSSASSVRTQLQAIKDSGARVIVLSTFIQDAITVFSQAAEIGITGEGWVWIGTHEPTREEVFADRPTIEEAMNGIIGTRPEQFLSAEKTAFLDLWENCAGESASVYAGCGDRTPNTYAPFAYDATFVFARALQKMVVAGEDYTNGPKLLAELAKTEFIGATGSLRFNSNYDRISDYDIVNLQGTTFKTIGKWTPTGVTTYAAVILPGGVTINLIATVYTITVDTTTVDVTITNTNTVTTTTDVTIGSTTFVNTTTVNTTITEITTAAISNTTITTAPSPVPGFEYFIVLFAFSIFFTILTKKKIKNK